MKNPELHISYETSVNHVFHEDIGWLALSKAGNIKVWVKEFKDDEKKAIDEFNKKNEAEKEKLQSQLELLKKKQRNSDTFINQNYSDTVAGKVSKETYAENLRIRNEDTDKRNKKSKEISNQLRALTDFENSKEAKLLKEKYAKLRWVWQLIGSEKPKLIADSYNEAIVAGQGELNLTFHDFLEGGGASYLEPFWEGDIPTGTYPHGLLINAKSSNSEIITADWRDANEDIINEPVAFGSTIFLNIYTQNLYGHNIKIQLKDKDRVIRLMTLGITDADDKLFAAEYLNNGISVNERDEEDISKKENQFVRPVNVVTTTKFPKNAKYGLLISEDENKKDKKVTHVPNVQKCKFAVYIDPLWKILAGHHLEIYPEIEHSLIPGGKKTLSGCTLEVKENGKEIKVEKIDSNQVAVISEVEPNMEHFNPCGYDTITALLRNIEYPIFTRNNSVIEKELKLEIITDDKPSNLWVYLPDLNTIDCTYNNIDGYHTGKVIILKNAEQQYKNLVKNEKDVSFDVSYPRPTVQQLIDYAWLPNVKPILYKLQFDTCRFQHPLAIEIYPQLEYTFNVHLGVEESEYLYVTQTKNYKRREYEGKKKNGTKAAKRDHNKRLKENFKDDVDSQVKKDNFREKYKVSVGAEYKFGKEDPIAVDFALLKTLEDVIENILYVYDTIDSYLQGDQMNQVEQGEEFDAAGNRKNLTPKQKAKNRAEYKSKKRQRQAKKKKIMPEATDFPVRLEITPPKFTGGVTWDYKQSQKEPNLIGVNYQFKFGALPLIGVTGRLDILFGAQFIPYLGQVVKALDKAVAAVNKVGDALEFLKLGTMEAEYYFDLVVSNQLYIDVIKGMSYHSIDGFIDGHLQIESPLSISLEAGGSIKMELINIKGEAAISASATAKFKLYYVSDKKEFLTFEFEGVEAIVKTKLVIEEVQNGDDDENESEPEPVPIFSGFKIDIPLFKKQIVENPHKDEK